MNNIISLIDNIFDFIYLSQLVSLFYFILSCCNYNCVALLFVVQIVSHLKSAHCISNSADNKLNIHRWYVSLNYHIHAV
jgi:hypothetical protein